MNAATTLNLSLLNTIGGSFSQIQCQQFKRTNLTGVGGNFSPSTMAAITAITCGSLSNVGVIFHLI
jgi:hypothetical protein